MIYKNQKEIIITEENIVSICLYGDNKNSGQESFILNTSINGVFAFSNGFNEGYVEYNYETKTIKTNGNISTYIVVI